MSEEKHVGTEADTELMKILYIGHYKEGTGWSRAAIDLILSMHKVGLDVTCRNIKLTTNESPINPTLSILENKPLKNIDICIQHVLPHHMVSTSKFKKNIAHYVGESSTILDTSWAVNLRYMDEIWIPNHSLKNNLANDGFTNTRVIPYAFDIEAYSNKSIPSITFNNAYARNTFKFYYIGEMNDRKNVEAIIRSFHSEFAKHEPVSLILKIKSNTMSSVDLGQQCHNLCARIKNEMRIYADIKDYHSEIIIAENLLDEHIEALHNSCDCFVGPSHGEGWSIPAFHAMCFGNTPICSKEGGPLDFIDQSDINTGSLINGVYSVCQHKDPAFQHIFTGKEEWFCPSESEIKKAMRYYYNNSADIDRSAGLRHAEKYSYENVGAQIKEALYAE